MPLSALSTHRSLHTGDNEDPPSAKDLLAKMDKSGHGVGVKEFTDYVVGVEEHRKSTFIRRRTMSMTPALERLRISISGWWAFFFGVAPIAKRSSLP